MTHVLVVRVVCDSNETMFDWSNETKKETVMKAATTKLLTVGIVTLALIGGFTLLGNGNAEAKPVRPDIPLSICSECAPQIVTQSMVCRLVGCAPCQYSCETAPCDK